MKIKTLKTGALSVASLVLLMACSNTEAPEQSQDSGGETTTAQQSETTSEQVEETTTTSSEQTDSQNQVDKDKDASSSFAIDRDAAVDIFLGEYPEAQIEEIKLERDTAAYAYEVSGFNANEEYDIDIDAETGEITAVEFDTDNRDGEGINFDNIISVQEAFDHARSELGEDVNFESWKLDIDRGHTAYEIETQTDIEITIDAETGDVLEID